MHRGEELFNTSIGPRRNQRRGVARRAHVELRLGFLLRLPSERADGRRHVVVVPGRAPPAISMESTAEHAQVPVVSRDGAPLLPSFRQRVLNWSAVRDEVQDFELNIRAVSGGRGLIRDGAAVVNLQPTANTGRDADLDAVAAYIAFGIRAPISPRRGGRRRSGTRALSRRPIASNATVAPTGRGAGWITRPRRSRHPRRSREASSLVSCPRWATFDPAAFNEVRGAGTTIVTANGSLGFNVPSLLSVFAGGRTCIAARHRPWMKSVDNVTHRAPAPAVSSTTLTNSADRETLVQFLESIDAVDAAVP